MKIEIRKAELGGSFDLFREEDGEALGLRFPSLADAEEGVRIAQAALRIAGKKATVRKFVNERARTIHVQVNGHDVFHCKDVGAGDEKAGGLRNVVSDVLHAAGVELGWEGPD